MPDWIPVPGLKVAIDGPSGSGKGTVAAMLARKLCLPVLDTGLLYRFVGWKLARMGVKLDDEPAVLASLDAALADMRWEEDDICDGQESVGALLRGEDVGRLASMVAAMPGVRARLLDVQRRLAADGCVMDGRDIGTVVLPDAQAKFFLTASARERARRRWRQLRQHDPEIDLDAVHHDIRMRDAQDAGRRHAPLEQAGDAIRIDSTTLRVDEVVDRMLAIMARRGLIRRSASSPGRQ